MELNGFPDGSRPTRCHSASPTLPSANVRVKTLEMLWMEKALIGIACAKYTSIGHRDSDAELLRIDNAQLRNIGRDLAPIGAGGHLCCETRQDVARFRACRYLSQRSMRSIAVAMSSWLPA